MRADAGEDGLFVAFGVYPDGVRRLGAFAIAGGNAGEEVGVFCFEAVLRGAALGKAVAGGVRAAAEDKGEVGVAVGFARGFERAEGGERDATAVVLVGVGGVTVAVRDVPFAAREGGQDGLL